MNETLTEIAGFKLTVSIAGTAISILLLILFAALWIWLIPKKTEEGRFRRRWLDALGFGLLPAAAGWKIFADMYAAGKGAQVVKPLPLTPWATENGLFNPCRIEAAAALIAFAGICLWLMLRKEEPEGRGEVFLNAVCLWSGIRIVTESFREEPQNILRFVYCGAVLFCLAVWTYKRVRQTGSKQRSIGDWIAALLCTGMIAATATGLLSVGSEIADLAVITGCALLEVVLTMLCGSDNRKARHDEKA